MALYAEIISVGLVGVPRAGRQVYVNVTIKNLASTTIGIMVGGALEYGVIPWPTIGFDVNNANFPPGASYYFSGSFVVPYYPPGKVIKVHAYSYWYGADGMWYFDDEMVKSFEIIGEEEPEEELETLEVDITPAGTGYVTTSPASEEGKTTWHNGETGTFPYGTNVRVTAHAHSGYVFEKWSDEIVGGVSYQNPEYVKTMTEHRAVKCHFVAEEAPVPEFSQFGIVDYNTL